MQRKPNNNGNKSDEELKEPSIINSSESEKIKKKMDLLITPNNGPSNLRNLTVSLLSTMIGSWCYFKSLIGGDDEFVIKHVGEIGMYLLLSVVLYQVAYHRSLVLIGRALKIGVIATISMCLYLTLRYDQGASFDHHGEFNIAAFAAIFSVITIVSASIYVIRKLHALKAVCSVFGVLVIMFCLGVINAKGNFGKGIFGERMQTDIEGCPMPQSFPFIDLLPRRHLNFFTGSESCEHWFASKPFSTLKDGLLTMDCKNNPRYIINPNFVNREPFFEWHQGEKVDTSNLTRPWNTIKYQDIHRNYEKPVMITEGEFIRTFCGDKEEYHVQHVPIQGVIDRSTARQNARKAAGKTEDPNVVFLVIDSVSRQHFIRRLPKTVQTIENLDARKGGNYHVNQFFRHSAVGCCTPTNMRALLHGLDRDDQTKVADMGDYFVWTPFMEAGYSSLWLNDICQDYFNIYFHTNSSFTDHEMLLPFCHYEYVRASNAFSNFKGGPYSIEKRCIGQRYVHSYAFQYMTEFFDHYDTIPKFIGATFAEAHESSAAVITTMDEDLSKFIKGILKNHPNTVFVITADHGLHLGPWALSPPGKTENSLPALFTIMPSSIQTKHPEMKDALKHNQQTLTTQYDLHKTIVHLLNYPEYKAPEYPEGSTYKKSASSMLETIPYTRNCDQAGVPKKMCLCTNK